jgi:hypothetical protein
MVYLPEIWKAVKAGHQQVYQPRYENEMLMVAP